MALDLDQLGATTSTFQLEYDWKTLALYALGIGARREDLDYVYEGRGPRVYPTFGVVPSYPVLTELMARSGGDVASVVHGAQTVRVHAPLPPQGTLMTVGKIAAMYDLKRMAQLVLTTETKRGGELVYTTEWSLVFRADGGFGGPRPEKRKIVRVPQDRQPDFTFEEEIPPQQALLYRLSGDTNPLHADPEFARNVGFEQGPILHGLATFGYIGRALVHGYLDGDPSRVRALSAQFSNPVWPGEHFVTNGYVLDGEVALQSFAGGRTAAVVTNCYAELAPSP